MQVQPSTPLPGRIKSQNPNSHPPSSNTRICACKPSASVSPGPERHTLAQHQTDARGAHPDHTSCSTAAQRYPSARPGCKPPGPGIGQANMSGTLSSSPAEADAGLAASCQDCQWHGPGDSSLVAGPAATTPPCATKAFDVHSLRAAPWAHARCTWVHASPLSGPSRRRRRPRDGVLLPGMAY